MRTKTALAVAALTAAGALTSMAQVYSVNIVGYINLNVPANFSMIACQLNATPDNKLSTIMPTVAEGTSIYKFDRSLFNGLGGFAPQATWSADNPGWDRPDYTLNPGEGAFIASPGPQTITFVGEVKLTSSTAIGQGYQILSSVIPQQGTLDALGFPSSEGDNVFIFNTAKFGGQGGFDQYSWSADNPGWQGPPGAPVNPTVDVGQAFFMASPVGSRSWDRTFPVGP